MMRGSSSIGSSRDSSCVNAADCGCGVGGGVGGGIASAFPEGCRDMYFTWPYSLDLYIRLGVSVAMITI